MDVKNAIPVSAHGPSGSRAVELSRRTCRNRVRRDSFCSRERWSGAVGRRVLTEGTSTLYSRRLFNTTHTAATKLCPIKRSRGRKHRSSSHLLLEQAAGAQPPFQKLSPQPTQSSRRRHGYLVRGHLGYNRPHAHLTCRHTRSKSQRALDRHRHGSAQTAF